MNKKPAPIKVLHFTSTSRDQCGVGRYQEQYLAGMANIAEVSNAIFGVSPYQTRIMSATEVDRVAGQLTKELQDYDILHIQHEFSLFWHDQFVKIVQAGKAAGKKIIVTLHLSPANVPELAPVKLGGLGPRSWISYLRQLRRHLIMSKEQIAPMKEVDMLLVHTQGTAAYLQNQGIDPTRITIIPHPISVVSDHLPASKVTATHLNKKPGDVILCITGFLHRYKGVPAAIRALKFLPENYKLLLAGGVKGDSDQVNYEDQICNLIDKLGLKSRVYITGFIDDHDELDAIIRECDICIFPYDRVYYANASSGALGLGFSNAKPVVAYPTASIQEAAEDADGAIVLCQTFAYYELAREVQRIDIAKQEALSKAYAAKLAWPKMAKELVKTYQSLFN